MGFQVEVAAVGDSFEFLWLIREGEEILDVCGANLVVGQLVFALVPRP